MPLINSIKILLKNFNLNYKIALYRLCVVGIMLAFWAIIIIPVLWPVFTSAEAGVLATDFKRFLSDLFATDTSHYGAVFNADIADLLIVFGKHAVNMVFAFIGFILVLFGGIFLSSLGDYTAGVIMNDYFTAYSKSPFVGTYIRNLSKAVKFNLVFAFCELAADILIIIVCYFSFILFLNFLGLFAITILFIEIFGLTALKLTVFSDFLPSAVSADKPKIKDLCQSFGNNTPKNFGAKFSTFLISSIIIFMINILTAVFTFGASLILTIPLSFLFITILKFLFYFHDTQKKYYLDYDHIIIPASMREETEYMGDDL